MNIRYIEEPLLEFGRGSHICPRFGITQHDVYDSRMLARRERILLGVIGNGESIENFLKWIKACSEYIPPPIQAKQPNLFPPFCGFTADHGFKSEMIVVEEITRKLKNTEMRQIAAIKDRNERVNTAVDLFYDNSKFLAQNRNVDVIVCLIPKELYKVIATHEEIQVEETIEGQPPSDDIENDFRRLLKARTMHLARPIQIMREASLDMNARGQQDAATKAWNFCTAIYYKASQTVPWRIPSNPNRQQTCYLGVGFYRSRDRKALLTSLAQIFDELGNGVILRGTPVDISKDDRRPHLSSDQANNLIINALEEYRVALGNSPARLVIHKSSNFNAAEIDGFRQAADEIHIGSMDFVTIGDSIIRAFRTRSYPVCRGTHIEMDEKIHLLYTRGSVLHYSTYPGLYVPQPLEIRIVESDESPNALCDEILALTKMNWNNTRFDGKYPITIQCARRVGDILKYISEEEKPQIRYSYYM